MIIPIEAYINANNAFLANSLPITGDTTLRLASFSYFLAKYSFISIDLSCAKLSLEWTVACFLSGDKTIFSSFTFKLFKSSWTLSIDNSVFAATSIRVPLEKSIPKLSLFIPREIDPAIIIAILNAKNFFMCLVKLSHSNLVLKLSEFIPNLVSWILFLLTPK